MVRSCWSMTRSTTRRSTRPVRRPGIESLWRSGPSYDRRYARVRRPVVLTGGELTLDQLDLRYDHFTKLYQAPFQVKANGGVLIVDDFGRQRVPPRDLLNRWIVPLEKQDRLPDPAHRRQVSSAVRLPADLRHQPGPGRAGRRSVSAAYPLQDPSGRSHSRRSTRRFFGAVAKGPGWITRLKP